MQEAIDQIKKQFDQEIATASSTKVIEELKIRYLGKKGIIADKMRLLRDVKSEDKPLMGKLFNDLKVEIENELVVKSASLLAVEEDLRLSQEIIDVTLPGRKVALGSKHPITAILDEIVDIFVGMGFTIELAPEIETDYYNFDALNFQPDHPAKDMQDTFYVAPQFLLRTHATNFQGRIMETRKPPYRVICPGRVFRNETISARSHVFFHQVDGLYLDEGVTLQDMMSTLSQFIQKLFKKEVGVRFRPSYFPFVEPGCEVDVACVLCDGKGCPICKHSGWLEILGAGMVHPEVLRKASIDPEKYTGFAWGLGVERLILLRYGIQDIRYFAENDLKFLSQFPSM